MFMVCQLCMEPLLCYMGIELWTWSLMLLLSWKSYTRQEVRLKLCNLANAFTEKAQVMVLWGRSKWYHDRQWFEEWTRLLKRRRPARHLWGNDIQADVVVLKCSLQILAYSSHIKRGSLCPCPLPLESRLSADKQHRAKATPCHFQGWGLKETASFSFLSRWGMLALGTRPCSALWAFCLRDADPHCDLLPQVTSKSRQHICHWSKPLSNSKSHLAGHCRNVVTEISSCLGQNIYGHISALFFA